MICYILYLLGYYEYEEKTKEEKQEIIIQSLEKKEETKKEILLINKYSLVIDELKEKIKDRFISE